VVQTRTHCGGPSGRTQIPHVARTLLDQVAPQAAYSEGVRRIHEVGGFAAFDAATLTTLNSARSYRMTYWYEVDAAATGSREELKWYLAKALLTNRDATVTVVSELEELRER